MGCTPCHPMHWPHNAAHAPCMPPNRLPHVRCVQVIPVGKAARPDTNWQRMTKVLKPSSRKQAVVISDSSISSDQEVSTNKAPGASLCVTRR